VHVRLLSVCCDEPIHQGRFAGPGFACDGNDASLTFTGQCKRLSQALQLFVALQQFDGDASQAAKLSDMIARLGRPFRAAKLIVGI
jgi:hypothetical protein